MTTLEQDMPDAIEYIYILGANHCGATLLALLLNTHPDVATIGQAAPSITGSLEDYLCSCRAPFLRCPFWQRIRREMRRENPEFELGSFGTAFEDCGGPFVRRLLRAEHHGPYLEMARDFVLRMSPAWRQHFQRTAQNCRSLAATVLRFKCARVFVDTSKITRRLKFLLRVSSLRIKLIHLIRDGRAVALTYMDEGSFADAHDPAMRRGGRGPSNTGRTMSMARASHEWRRDIRSAECVRASANGVPWLEVRYENLCQSPREALHRIFVFLGLDPSRATRDHRSVEHHILGNSMRLDATAEIRLDERWRSVLTPQELREFDSVAGEMNRRYGYT